jgi:hypothetical protein
VLLCSNPVELRYLNGIRCRLVDFVSINRCHFDHPLF